METDPQMPEAPHETTRWPWRLGAAFIVSTLLVLVLVPWQVQREVRDLRADIQASEPARTLVMQWQFDLVREMSALSELLLTGDTAQVERYADALASEDEILRRLTPLAARLGTEVQERLIEARGLAEQWHARMSERGAIRELQAGRPLMGIPRERRLFERVLNAVAAVDSAIIRTTAEKRGEIETAERRGLLITAGLGVLALLASGGVIALDTRVRRSAGEAERRRAIADAALAESAQASEARNRLLRGITHDVKNPLGAARGYAELLALEVRGPLSSDQRTLVEGVERSIDSALAIIADLLDLARVGSGTISVQRSGVDLNDVAREAAADYDVPARAAGHQLAAEIGDEPVPAHTDPLRVRQVLDNLLSNAIKYTPASGRIAIRARAVRNAEGPRPGAWAVLEVSDTGPGIPPEMRDVIFDEFARLDERSAVKGHGLGLAVARGLSHRLGGDLTIADTPAGATFQLWLPQDE